MANSLAQLFEPNPNRQPSFLSNKWTQISTALFGFGFVCFYNFFTKRPVLSGKFTKSRPDYVTVHRDAALSGIQKHLIATSLGAVGGQLIEDRRLDYLAERDAVLRNYIELHPDDFPVPERKKYAEVIEPWIPIR